MQNHAKNRFLSYISKFNVSIRNNICINLSLFVWDLWYNLQMSCSPCSFGCLEQEKAEEEQEEEQEEHEQEEQENNKNKTNDNTSVLKLNRIQGHTWFKTPNTSRVVYTCYSIWRGQINTYSLSGVGCTRQAKLFQLLMQIPYSFQLSTYEVRNRSKLK